MTPREALIALIQCDPNRSYSVSLREWAHLPALAGNPPDLETFVEVFCRPGFDGNREGAGFFHEETIQGAVSKMLAAIRRDNARSALAMVCQCSACGAAYLPASTTPSAETEPQ